jgi:hypothetical protein
LKDAIDAGTDLASEESSSVLATAVGYATAYVEKRAFIPGLCLEDERVSFLDDHQGIRAFAKLYRGRNGLRISGGLFAACHYLFAQKSEADATQFMKDVLTGEVLDNEDPAWRYREWIDKLKVRRTVKMLGQAGWVLVDAWNRFRARERMAAKLRVPLTAPEIE